MSAQISPAWPPGGAPGPHSLIRPAGDDLLAQTALHQRTRPSGGHRLAHRVWTPVTAAQQEWAKDPARFDGVRALGVDEHMWHRVSRRERGPQERTGMVDAIRDLGQR